MSSSSYGPDESADIISDEVAWLQGAFVSSLLCGVQITLSTLSFLAVLKQRMHRRLRIALLVYIFLLCAIMTAGQQTNLLFVQMGFIESRNYPGGPNAYLSYRFSTPVDVASTSLFVWANWMMESLLVSVGVGDVVSVINFERVRCGGVKSFVAQEIVLYGSGLSFHRCYWLPSMVRSGRHLATPSVFTPTLTF